MLGDRIRVDLGPDTNLHMQRHGLEYDRLEHLLVTHSHADHWFPQELYWRRTGFSTGPQSVLTVWGNEAVAAEMHRVLGTDLGQYRIEFREIGAWDRLDLGAPSAVAVPAAHDPEEVCLNYLIEVDSRRALIAHDTGWYPTDTWARIAETPLDLVLFDCTYGSEDHDRGHMGCAAVVRARDELAARGGLAPGSTVVATHFSHNGGWLHDDLVAYFAPHAIEVAYDGLRLEI